MKRLLRNGCPADDRGSGTIWVAAMAVILCVVAIAVMLLGLAQTARHKANSAADLAALAAAQVLVDGTGSPCGVASGNAAANGARLASCAVAGEVVSVSVSVDVRLGRFGLGTATATARAGPVGLAPAPSASRREYRFRTRR